jgi:hypothetical protein
VNLLVLKSDILSTVGNDAADIIVADDLMNCDLKTVSIVVRFGDAPGCQTAAMGSAWVFILAII